jgi:hypothetical protein
MEHRYTDRYASDLSILIYQHKLPVAIGRIKNGSQSGVFIETDYANIHCEHQVTLEVLLNRNSVNKLQRIEIDALVIHKTAKGFGATIEHRTQEQKEFFVEILRGVNTKPQNSTIFSMVANS